MAENRNGNTTAKEIRPEDIQPETWKLFNTRLAVDRFSNPTSWEFRILKKTSFRPAWMKNMFSKYWNTPPIKDDDQKTIDKAEEMNETSLTEEQCEGLNGQSEWVHCEHSDEAAKPYGEKDKSLGNLKGTKNNSELLDDGKIQDLKNLPEGQIRILWIGHASLLIQIEGKNILTDPIFSSKAGPKNMVGYIRYRSPAVTVAKLKEKEIKIDAVLISHNHYDHYDKQSVCDLKNAFPEIEWFVPKNLKSDLDSLQCKNVKEAEWWDCLPLGSSEEIKFHFTPAKHWSGRNPTDWYTSLWGSWIIESKTAKVFFAGDTGFQKELFEAIKKKFDPITVAALPIGAYEPREMMKCQHINPEEAVKIHNILGVKKSIGIHWRTFQLSCEGVDQPIEDLALARKEHGVKEEDFVTLENELITTIECDQGSTQSLHKPD